MILLAYIALAFALIAWTLGLAGGWILRGKHEREMARRAAEVEREASEQRMALECECEEMELEFWSGGDPRLLVALVTQDPEEN